MNISTKKKIGTVAAVVSAGILLTACNLGSDSTQSSSVNNDQSASSNALAHLQQAEPTPYFQWSQLRQTLIEIESAQANTTQTTSFFFNQGVANPVQSCPSIGFPIAADSELTNPSQVYNDSINNGQAVVIPQVDPTGIYTGNTTGTYVMCVAPNGQTYADYWEGFVQTVSGPAVWNAAAGKVELVGPATGGFTKGK